MLIILLLVGCRNCAINKISRKAHSQFYQRIIGKLDYIEHEKFTCTFYINKLDSPFYIQYLPKNGIGISDIVKRGDSVYKFENESIYYFITKSKEILIIDFNTPDAGYNKITVMDFNRIKYIHNKK